MHRQGLHKPIVYLNRLLKQDLIIVDGIYGDLEFEEGGNPVKMNRIIAGQDPVLIDSYAAELLGFSPEEIEYIEIADKIKVGKSNIEEAEIIEFNKVQSEKISYTSYKLKKLADKIDAQEVCSACYGSLIHALKRIEKEGMLDNLKGKIKIGQGFKGETIKGTGIGNCCQGADKQLIGCPPSARKIYKFLESII